MRQFPIVLKFKYLKICGLLVALVLAPFFVHLECLFYIGFKPTLHKRIVNLVGIEITRIRKLEGQKKREADAAVAGADGEKSKTQ